MLANIIVLPQLLQSVCPGNLSPFAHEVTSLKYVADIFIGVTFCVRVVDLGLDMSLADFVLLYI